METITTAPLIRTLRTKVKRASLLYLEGFKEACCLHRVVILCLRSRRLLIRTGQCFLLNGFIFLGSIFVLNSVIIPTLQWILPDQCSDTSSQEPCTYDSILKLYSFLHIGLIQLFYITLVPFFFTLWNAQMPFVWPTLFLLHFNGCVLLVIFLDLALVKVMFLGRPNQVFWFYPLYLFSFILSTIWYNDIAKYGFSAMGRDGRDALEHLSQNEVTTTSDKTGGTEKPVGLGGIMIGIGEQLYSILLLSFFFLEVYATGFMPYIGKAFNFVLLSWMYAYYCFEYKWNFSEVPLDRRLDFFESNWAFFAGFGSPCVLAIFFFSPLVSYGVMAILYPLFVLTATGSGAEQLFFSQRQTWKGVGLGRLPIFYAADTLLMWILSFIPLESQEQIQDKAL